MGRPKPLLILCYLCVEDAKERRDLAELFYIGASNPMASLRVALKHIRDEAEDSLETDGSKLRALVPSDVSGTLAAIENGDYAKAVELYGGPFLEGFFLKDWGVELEEWVYATREYIALRVRQAMLTLANEHAARSDFDAAANLAKQAFKLAGAPDPEPEQFRQFYALMLTVDVFETGELKQMAADYGVELNLTKDEARASFILSQPDQVPTNMRAYGNSFVGRSEELGRIEAVLNDPECRLLTLHGPGGTGKTRLVAQAALGQLKQGQFKDGVYFVALDALTHPDQILTALATTLELSLKSQNTLSEVSTFIAEKKMLIVFDNFEHLSAGATLTSDLLAVCSHLKLLATSRERLNVPEEYALAVGGLTIPGEGSLSVEHAKTYDTVRLFVDRAKRTNLDFDLTPESLSAVVAIARYVEGLPLGIELAAASLRLMTPQAVAESLEKDLGSLYTPTRDTPERHQSLRATLDYSWRLLSEKEQTVLSKLAVCVGGFTRDAASAVADATIPDLMSLVGKAFLRTTPDGRFERHMLVYQYTLEKLGYTPDPAQTEERHARYYTRLAQDAESQLISKGQLEWLNRLEHDKENLRKALRWNLDNDVASALKQAAALRRFWEIRGYYAEGIVWFKETLDKAEDRTSLAYLEVLYAAGALLRAQHEVETAERYFQECMVLAKQLENRHILADTLNQIAGIAWYKGNLDDAHALLEKSLVIKRELEDTRGIAVSLKNLGLLANTQQNYALATTLYSESLIIYKQLGDQHEIVASLRSLGVNCIRRKEFDKAKAFLRESLNLCENLEDKKIKGQLLVDIGRLHCFEENYHEAEKLISQGLGIAKDLGIARNLRWATDSLGILSYAQQDFTKAAFHFRCSLGLANDNDLPNRETAFDGLACVAAIQEDYQSAAVLWGVVRKLNAAPSTFRHRFPEHYEEVRCCSRSTLGTPLFESMLREGDAFSPERAVKFALEINKLDMENIPS